MQIKDGRPRTLSFVTAPDGTIIQRDEADGNAGGDPREVYYYFDGIRVGDVSNNGTSDTDYAASMTHAVTAGTGAFRGGAATGSVYADFDQSYDPINGLTYDAVASRYTVRDGDTLASIAQTVWGDASLWYMLADANGLDGSETLPAGRDLVVPNKVANLHNTSATYRVYDPNDTIGNTTPSDPAPGRHHGHHCGAFGQILLIAVAVAVSFATYGALTGPATAGLAAIEAGAAAGAAGSIASQGVGLATGIQDKFSFKGVALAAIAGGVGAGVGEIAGLRGATGIAGFGQGVARGVIGSALTQGIALATGLQHRFDWAGVAAAGLSGGVFGAVDPALARAGVGRFVGTALSNTAAAIAGAGAQSLLTGSDFGDTLMRSLPQVIGETIGNTVGEAIEAQGAGGSGSGGDPDTGGRGGGASGGWSNPGDTGGFTISVARGYQPAPATIDNGTTASAEAGAMAASGGAGNSDWQTDPDFAPPDAAYNTYNNTPVRLIDLPPSNSATGDELVQLASAADRRAPNGSRTASDYSLWAGLDTAASLLIPGYGFTESAIGNARAGNYWAAGRDALLATGEVGLAALTLGEYQVAAGTERLIARGTASALEHTAAETAEAEGVVYSRIDLNGKIEPYGGQAQSYDRYLQRQIEHARNYPDADFDFTIVDRANPGVELDVAEHQYIQQLTGGVRASKSPLVSNLKDPVGPARRPGLGLPEPRGW